MADLPFIPWYGRDFRSDTEHLGALEVGAYALLLMVAWELPNCRLPDDDKKLAKWARVESPTWSEICHDVMAFWTKKRGYWVQSRLHREWVKAKKKAEISRKNGRGGGRPRKNPAGIPLGSLSVSKTEPKKKLSTLTVTDTDIYNKKTNALCPLDVHGTDDQLPITAETARNLGGIGVDPIQLVADFRKKTKGKRIDDPDAYVWSMGKRRAAKTQGVSASALQATASKNKAERARGIADSLPPAPSDAAIKIVRRRAGAQAETIIAAWARSVTGLRVADADKSLLSFCDLSRANAGPTGMGHKE